METVIIMTSVTCPAGRYTKFTVKDSGRLWATVDRIDGRYVVFAWDLYTFSQVGTRTKKAAAIKLAQNHILGLIEDAVFKWNVMAERYK